MASDFAFPQYGSAAGYAAVETLFDEAANNKRRHSRGSSGQRTAGSVRIMKPNSTSNSPRTIMGLGRRRTVMTDRRRMGLVDQVPGVLNSTECLQVPVKSNRPVSWHPSSHLGPQPIHYPSDSMSYLNAPHELQFYDLPPTPAVYSGHNSPMSTFSPLSAPYISYDEQRPYLDSSVSYMSNINPAQAGQAGAQQFQDYFPTLSNNTESTLYSHFDWSNFAANGFERSTAPPTPDNFFPVQHPDPTFSNDESIPYHALSESTQEEEGEILCGMGLYDSPDSKAATPDPHLDNYRSSMMSQLLGATYRKEPTGKGLKLEETWNPPPSDDEDDDDSDEKDGEGDDDEEAIAEAAQSTLTHNASLMQSVRGLEPTGLPNTTSSSFTIQSQDRINWL